MRASASPTRAPVSAWADAIPLGLVLAAAAVLQGGALRAGFFADDYLFLDVVGHRSLPAALASPDPLGNFFRPVSRALWFWCVSRSGGATPLAFHLANLGLLLAIVAMLFAIVRRVGGSKAATIASGVVALHYAADVPVWWASGSQDLLAVCGALAAILLALMGRAWLGAVALFLGLLSKETVVLTPAVAWLVARRTGERWGPCLRRVAPLLAALGVWVIVWMATAARRPMVETELRMDARGLPAALLHLLQVAPGIEWAPGAWPMFNRLPPLAPLLLVLAAIVGVTRVRERMQGTPGARPGAVGGRLATIGLAWAALAALPVAAVAGLWSAYYYLFAMCGFGMFVAGLCEGWPGGVSLALVALLAWTSQSGRHLATFSTVRDPWKARSGINGHYLERGMRVADLYLQQLKRLRPTLPPRSTIFFAGLPPNVAFQAGNGPLVRWAYDDSSLVSYYLGSFTVEKARHGPNFFFAAYGDTLREIQGRDVLRSVAFPMMLSGSLGAANDALTLERERAPDDLAAAYWLAWTLAAQGDTAQAWSALRAAGYVPKPGPTEVAPRALALGQIGRVAEGIDLMQEAVRRHGLDGDAHGLLADLILTKDPQSEDGAVEAFAAVILGLRDPNAWRRWGAVQLVHGHAQALQSLERYLALSPGAAESDLEVKTWMATLKRSAEAGRRD